MATKDELLAEAKDKSIEVPSDATKADIQELLDNHQGDDKAQDKVEVNQGNDIAEAIARGFKSSKDDSFKLEADTGVESRFSLVKNKDGDVMLRENETGRLSRLQLESIEEKEASIQGQEVTEL